MLTRVVGPLRRRFWSVDPHPPKPLTAEQICDRMLALPVSTWTYEFEPGVRHLGPMSQDFAAAFGLGRTNRMIDMVDANGINVVVLKTLLRRMKKLEAEVQRLQHAEQDRHDTPKP